jgi:hypothetical protein
LFCVLAITGLITPPAVNYDAGLGFHTYASMSRGAAWNHTTSAAESDLSRDDAFFNAAFSPGQYMVPAAFVALGMKLGAAALLTSLLFTLAGCAGLWRLYRHLDFSPAVAAVATATVSVSRSTVLPFGMYNGGEVLLFGAFPWVILAGMWVLRAGHWRWILFPLLALAAAFLKLSFVLCCVGLIAAWVYGGAGERPGRRHAIGPALQGAALLGVTYFLVYLLYTSRSWTAAEPASSVAQPAVNFLLIVCGTVSAAFSGLQFVDHFYDPAAELRHSFQTPVPVLLLAAGACVSAWIVAKVLRRSRGTEYGRLLGAFLATSVPMLLYLFSAGGSWFEERHLRPVSLLLLPGLIAWAMRELTGRRRTLALVCVTGATAVYGTGAFLSNLQNRRVYAASERTGLTQWNVSRATLAALDAVLAEGERDGTGGLAVSTNHALSVEVSRPWRFTHDPGVCSPARRYEGAVARLMVHVPKSVPGDIASRVRESFPGMTQWWVRETDDAVLLYSGAAGPQHSPGWRRLPE